MRRKDRERDRSFAWEVLKKAPYATLSLTDGQGRPYAVPVNQAVDEEYHVVYFHCAGAGEKWELLKDGAEVCLSAVSHATAVPNAFTMAYASAVLRGRAEVLGVTPLGTPRQPLAAMRSIMCLACSKLHLPTC